MKGSAGVQKRYLWNKIHCAAVTMASCESFRADSFVRTVSSLYVDVMRSWGCG